MSLEGRELGWDDSIEKDGNDFIVVPEGDYDFEVISYERGRHNGSDKLPPCNKAVVKIKVETEAGATIISHQLFLHTITEGMLSSFFAAIGQKKKGERMTMNWNLVPGSKGRAKVAIRTWKDNDGNDRQSNEIKSFYHKEERAFKPGEF